MSSYTDEGSIQEDDHRYREGSVIKEHNKYLDTDKDLITLDNITFKANLNNHAFNKTCTKTDDITSIPLDILFIIKPLKPTSSEITLPVYSALLDNEKNIIDIQYFSLFYYQQVHLTTI